MLGASCCVEPAAWGQTQPVPATGPTSEPVTTTLPATEVAPQPTTQPTPEGTVSSSSQPALPASAPAVTAPGDAPVTLPASTSPASSEPPTTEAAATAPASQPVATEPAAPLAPAPGQTPGQTPAQSSPATSPAGAPGHGVTGALPELKGRPVEEVRILGNTTVSNAIIRNLIRTHQGDPFDPLTVQDDYQRVFGLKKFSNVEAKVEPTTTGGVIVVFVVTEQRLIKSIKFQGNVHVDSQALRSAADLKEGEAIDTFRLALARQAITTAYREKNYPYASVDLNQALLTEKGEVLFTIVEGPMLRIRKVDFIGANSFDKDTLKDQIKTSSWIFVFRPGKYDPQQVDEDVASLRKFYENHGFFDVRVGRKLIISPDQSEMQVNFIINEGPRYQVARISFQGNASLGEAKLREGLKLTDGRSYDNELLQRDIRVLVKDYSPLGFIYQPASTDEDYLRIDTKTVFLNEPGKLELIYSIHEGKTFHLGVIRVKGNTKSQDKLVLREFRDFTPGSLFNSAAMEDAADRLRASPYFNNVTITPIGDDPAYRDLLVEVGEQRTASFNVGAGVNSNGGIGGNITFEQRNFDIANPPNDWRDIFSEHAFTGAGQGFRASFEPGTIQTNATLRFSEPYLFDQPYSFSDELYLRNRVREHYEDRRIGDRVSFGKRFDYIWSGLFSIRGEQAKVYGIEDDKYRAPVILEHEGKSILTSASLQLRRDTTNVGLFPYKGSVTQGTVEQYGAIGGDYTFTKFTLGYDHYQTVYEDLIDRRTVLGIHANTGFIAGHSTFLENFYAGGIGSLRGFRYRGVSPRGGIGEDPIGGDFMATASVELNFPLYGENLRGVIFTDGGDVESDVRLGTIRASVGAGIRLTLPFLGQAPLAIDFAIPVVQNHQDDTQLISFSFGFTP